MPHTNQTIAPDSEALVARIAALALDRHATDAMTLRVQVAEAGREVTTLDVPASAIPLIAAVLREMGDGKAVTVLGDDAEITTQEAADLLNVSRPFLIRILEEQKIPFTKTGRHRRVRAVDLFAYKAERDHQRSEALSDMAALDAAHGLI